MALSLKYVLLGMVVERPGYGYELLTRVKERLPAYNYTQGAVYPALDRLQQEQLIQADGQKRRRGTARSSPRVMYSATPAGITSLEQWMYTATAPERSRDALLAKVTIAKPQDVPRLLEMTRNQETQLRQQLGELQQTPAPAWSGRGRVPLPLVGAALLRSAEARRLSAAIESLQEAREALEHELRGAPSPRR